MSDLPSIAALVARRDAAYSEMHDGRVRMVDAAIDRVNVGRYMAAQHAVARYTKPGAVIPLDKMDLRSTDELIGEIDAAKAERRAAERGHVNGLPCTSRSCWCRDRERATAPHEQNRETLRGWAGARNGPERRIVDRRVVDAPVLTLGAARRLWPQAGARTTPAGGSGTPGTTPSPGHTPSDFKRDRVRVRTACVSLAIGAVVGAAAAIAWARRA